MSAVYVWVETFDGSANPTSWEALGAGRTLADGFSVPLTAIVFGENASAVANDAAKYGFPATNVIGVLEKKHFREAISFAQLLHSSMPFCF